MINKYLTGKFLILSMITLFVLSCATSKKSSVAGTSESNVGITTAPTPPESNSRGASTAVTPTPFSGTLATVKGQNPPIKFADNLENSVKQQELPIIWLEFETGNGKVVKTELSDEINESLKSVGEALFRYQYVKNHSDNPDQRYDATFNHSMTFEKSLNQISKLEIESPDGKRNLTEDEAKEILSKQAGLINDRYRELDDHFNPKSAFYRFRESVDKKLSYSFF